MQSKRATKCKRRRRLHPIRDKRGAAQYLTVMLLFSLGLGMVVAVDYLFRGLTNTIQENVAKERLEEATLLVRDKIIRTITIGQQSGQNSLVKTEVFLPEKVGTVYDFEITLSNSSDDLWTITSQVINTNTIIRFSTSFRVDGSRVMLSGKFLSTAPRHFILFYSGFHSQLSIDQCFLTDL